MNRRNLPLVSHDIELEEDNGIGPALRCGRCGEGFLHHGRVTIFTRGEDDETTAVTTVDAGLSASHLLPQRRGGIAIAFECEMCDGDLELTLAQHKGSTYLAWRFDPEPENLAASSDRPQLNPRTAAFRGAPDGP